MKSRPVGEREFKFTESDFKMIVQLVKDRTGIKLADHKKDMVYGRLARRLRELKFKTFADYCEYVASENGVSEIGNFVNAITTNLTGFFREGHHFDHLKEWLKDHTSSKGHRRIRIWSSASSSGQEPYSIAMTACEAIPSIASWDIKILATDIDTNMLNAGIQGEYDERLLEKIPPEYARKYVVFSGRRRSGDGVMSDQVKKLITFKQLNLMDNWPMKGPFDIIFCRNVVIYFDKPTQIKLFDKMANLLHPGGILYIGHSESLFNVSDRFKLIGRTIYQKIK